MEEDGESQDKNVFVRRAINMVLPPTTLVIGGANVEQVQEQVPIEEKNRLKPSFVVYLLCFALLLI